MDNKQKTLEILASISDKEASEITPEMELVANLNIDSPKALQLLVELEDAFGIEIDDEDAAQMDRVQDVLDYLGGRGLLTA
jgi:acyl carrier protein